MSLSGGERRRLEIARALVSDPQIILLDEPFTGIDPVTIDSIQTIIRDLRDRGIAILITDHQVRETLEITDRSYVIRGGQVLCHGRPQRSAQPSRSPQALLRRRNAGQSGRRGLGLLCARLACLNDERRPRDGRRTRLCNLRHCPEFAAPGLWRNSTANIAALVVEEPHSGILRH